MNLIFKALQKFVPPKTSSKIFQECNQWQGQ